MGAWFGHGPGTRGRLATLLAIVALSAAFAPAVLADGAQVTRGGVHQFAAGADLQITGRAQMIRTADARRS